MEEDNKTKRVSLSSGYVFSTLFAVLIALKAVGIVTLSYLEILYVSLLAFVVWTVCSGPVMFLAFLPYMLVQAWLRSSRPKTFGGKLFF